MITQEIILAIYAIILVELGLLLLILLLMVMDLRNSLDSIRKLIHRFVDLGHMTVDTAEELKSNLTSLSTLTSAISGITDFITSLRNKNKPSSRHDDTAEDDLDDVLQKIVPKKKKRVI